MNPAAKAPLVNVLGSPSRGDLRGLPQREGDRPEDDQACQAEQQLNQAWLAAHLPAGAVGIQPGGFPNTQPLPLHQCWRPRESLSLNGPSLAQEKRKGGGAFHPAASFYI